MWWEERSEAGADCAACSNYDCSEADDAGAIPDGVKKSLTIPDGANNLASIEWGTRIRSLRCRNFQQ